jgi:hypothetical protein
LRRRPFLRGTEGLRPWLGGTLEFSGVFAGSPTLASSSATRLVSRSISSACASTISISCSWLRRSRSARFIPSLNHAGVTKSKEISDGVSSYLCHPPIRPWTRRYYPDVEIGGRRWIARLQELAAVPAGELRTRIGSLAELRDALKRGLDILIDGF